MCIAFTRQSPSWTPLAATAFSTSRVMFTKSMRAGTFIVRCTVWDFMRASERPEATTHADCHSEELSAADDEDSGVVPSEARDPVAPAGRLIDAARGFGSAIGMRHWIVPAAPSGLSALRSRPDGRGSPAAGPAAAGLRRGRRPGPPRRRRSRRGRPAGDGPRPRGLRGRGGRPPADRRVLRAGGRAGGPPGDARRATPSHRRAPASALRGPLPPDLRR